MPFQSQSGPSGIAQQLRRSVDQSADMQSDAMNLDDFIVPSSVASPAGITAEISLEDATSVSQIGSIPIQKKPHTKPQMTAALPATSVPKHLPNKGRPGEFDYVQRRVRKTSIDDRSVRLRFLMR